MNIGLVNELKRIAHAMDLDVHEVIDAAATKPFGFMPFRPGPGLGGHCIPVDPYYLAWKARELGVPSDFVELAGRVNDAMPAYVVGRLRDALDGRGVPLRGARILLLGLAYKSGVPDTRESPAVEIFRLLHARGAALSYHDPAGAALPADAAPGGRGARPVERSAGRDALAEQDAMVLVTPQPGMDLALVGPARAPGGGHARRPAPPRAGRHHASLTRPLHRCSRKRRVIWRDRAARPTSARMSQTTTDARPIAFFDMKAQQALIRAEIDAGIAARPRPRPLHPGAGGG